MNNEKISAVIAEVNTVAAERGELIECIALALLAKKNLFILGGTGQAKSFCINEFRKRITGAKQFEYLISKQTDEEKLFGRLDLSSLIPGSMPRDELLKDTSYAVLLRQLEEKYADYEINANPETLKAAHILEKQLEAVREILCSLKPNTPKMITAGKIPDSHICFVDEIFKANDGILNSLLTALNEHVYTNEGQAVPIPVISFFAASNEIPNFADSSQAILKPLYDRFDLKVLTEYIGERENRLKILRAKQNGGTNTVKATVSLAELEAMQREVQAIKVPDEINDLADRVLCTLRQKGIHVSDRKFLSFSQIVRAKAYLEGRGEVAPSDLLVLKNYFWNKPEEIPEVEQILREICENPVGSEIDRLLTMAGEAFSELEDAMKDDAENLKPYIKFSSELVRIYKSMTALETGGMSQCAAQAIGDGKKKTDELNRKAAGMANATYISLEEKIRLGM